MLAFAKAVRFAGNRDKYEEFAEIPVLLRSVPRYLRSVGRNRAPRTVYAAWLWTVLPRLRLGYCFVMAANTRDLVCDRSLVSRGLVIAPSINRRTCVPDHRFVESHTCVPDYRFVESYTCVGQAQGVIPRERSFLRRSTVCAYVFRVFAG